MVKRVFLLCSLFFSCLLHYSWAQKLPNHTLTAIYQAEQTEVNHLLINDTIIQRADSLTAIDFYHLGYHAATNVQSDSLFAIFATKMVQLKPELRAPSKNLVTIGLGLLEKKLNQQFYTKYELNSILFDLVNTNTKLDATIENALLGSIILLIAKDIDLHKSFIDELTASRLEKLLHGLDFSGREELKIFLKVRALLAIGNWKLTTLNDPYAAAELIKEGITALQSAKKINTDKIYFESLDVLAEALLQSNNLLTSFYTRQIILKDLSSTEGYNKRLEIKNFTRIAYLFKKQNNPDSMRVYINHALSVTARGETERDKIEAFFLLADWYKDYKMDTDTAAFYLNYASQIMIENDIVDRNEVLTLVTKQLQLGSLDPSKKFTSSLTPSSYKLASRLSLSYDNVDKQTAISFFLELIIAAEASGNFSEIISNASYLKAFGPYFDSLSNGSIPWSFNAFLILNSYGEALRILNQNTSSPVNLVPYLAHVEEAVKAFLSIRTQQVIQENLLYLGHNVSALLSTSSHIYYALSRQIPDKDAKKEALEKAFVFADMNKAQLQVEQLVLANGLTHPNISTYLRMSYSENLKSAEADRRLMLQNPSYDALDDIFFHERRHQTITAEIEEKNPYWNAIWLESGSYLKQITDTIDQETSVVLYTIKKGKGRIFIVTSDGVSVVPIRYTESINKLSQELKNGLLTNDKQKYEEFAQSLSSILLSPIESFLKNRLIIIPNEEVSMVPFAMLPIKNDAHLIENHVLSTAPSLRVIAMEKTEKTAPKKRIATFIPITFDKFFSNERVSVERKLATNLPYSYLEGQNIISIIREKNTIFKPFNYYRISEFNGLDASKTNFTSELVTTAEIVHVATHAHTDVSNPENSKLMLNSALNEADATLMFRDISYLSLQANLLVLNGCETGSGKVLAGEGIIGITHAFLQTGVKNIIGTLWPIKDKAAALFMENYYGALFQMEAKERDYSLALQQAMIKMKAHPEYSNPINWSNFYCITSYGTLKAIAN